MKKRTSSQRTPHAIKRKMTAAVAMLLISSIMLVVVSFAWLTMSVAPEISGIATNIGANGSLEIALLNSTTRQDLTQIKTAVGQSLANRVTTANNTWGNLIDLSDEGYGLNNIILMPARLNAVAQSGGGYTVNPGMLSVPTYGYDGRIIELTDDTVSAVYKDSGFSYILGEQDYGVRAIGTSNSISVQGSALAMAKSNIATYTNSAKNSAMAAMNNNGDALMNIVIAHSVDSSATYDDSDIDTLETMIDALNASVNYIDLTLRQALIAYAASEIGNESLFNQVRNTIMDMDKELSVIMGEQDVIDLDVPADFTTWLNALNTTRNNINAAYNACAALSGGTYTWAQLRGIMDKVMNLDKIYVNDTLFSNMSADDFAGLMGKDFVMTLAPGSGVFADIADFTGDYSSYISAMGSEVEVTTMTTQKPTYLAAVAAAVRDLSAADGSAAGETEVKLTSTYGYALDMAFRCNAPLSDLLLQTEALQRIYDESTSPSTMGGGSYMEFSSGDESFTLEQTITLMDAVRVAFIDDQNTLLGIAKLNTSNRSVLEDTVKAPLYLYEYSFSENEEDYGALIMGERRKFDNAIVGLEQSIAKAVTVLVWLDGDVVDNTMVSAESETSLSGLLNLQFASSADLIPADNSALLYISPDKDDLNTLILDNKATYEAGQNMYTTVSWVAYAEAYEYAVNVSENMNANEAQVYNAALVLTKAKLALEAISLNVLGDAISSMRQFMGETTDPARYVLHDSEGKRYYSVDPYTDEQKDAKVGEIYRVDYNNNLRDEGNGVKTPVYTDESWSNLAAAIYDAEVLYKWSQYTNYQDIDAAITAMEVAYNALQLKVFFIPYDYNGALYYFAISEETDTYGKWYDSDFKRVVADLRILELDARAVVAEIAVIEQSEYISNKSQLISPYVDILDDVYPELTDEEILAVQWNANDNFVRAITNTQKVYLQDLISRAQALNVGSAQVASAQAILNKGQNNQMELATEVEAANVIAALEKVVVDEENRIAKEENDIDPAAEMTADQRTVLTAAVSAAKAVNGYDDSTNTDLAALRIATASAEALLAQETGATVQAAEDALDALNAQLKANGQKEVTAYNTLLHSLPMGSEVFEVVHTVDFSNTMLYPSGDIGSSELTAVVLTRNGVVLTVKKTVTIYAPAEDVESIHPSTAPAGGTVTENTDDDSLSEFTWDGKIKVGATTSLSIELIQNKILNDDFTYGESILECTWASEDNGVLTVLKDGLNGCIINAVGAGSTYITVTVVTEQGNTYTSSISVTVVK